MQKELNALKYGQLQSINLSIKLPNVVALERMMKIGHVPDSRVAGGNAGLPKPGQGTSVNTVSGKSSATKGVPVTVSDLALSVRSSTGDIDTAKVDNVRAAIANGTYAVNPEAIADKLLSNAKEMLKLPGGH